ncbi:hypothetical protein QTP88_019942 [Uroleucon formosanum]
MKCHNAMDCCLVQNFEVPILATFTLKKYSFVIGVSTTGSMAVIAQNLHQIVFKLTSLRLNFVLPTIVLHVYYNLMKNTNRLPIVTCVTYCKLLISIKTTYNVYHMTCRTNFEMIEGAIVMSYDGELSSSIIPIYYTPISLPCSALFLLTMATQVLRRPRFMCLCYILTYKFFVRLDHVRKCFTVQKKIFVLEEYSKYLYRLIDFKQLLEKP